LSGSSRENHQNGYYHQSSLPAKYGGSSSCLACHLLSYISKPQAGYSRRRLANSYLRSAKSIYCSGFENFFHCIFLGPLKKLIEVQTSVPILWHKGSQPELYLLAFPVTLPVTLFQAPQSKLSAEKIHPFNFLFFAVLCWS